MRLTLPQLIHSGLIGWKWWSRGRARPSAEKVLRVDLICRKQERRFLKAIGEP